MTCAAIPNPEVQAIMALCHHGTHSTDCPTCEIRANEGGLYLARIGKALIESFNKPAPPRTGPAPDRMDKRGRVARYRTKG